MRQIILKSVTLSLVVLALVLSTLPAAAQQQTVRKPASLFLGIGKGESLEEGDLWQYNDGGIQQKTKYGFNNTPVGSPDGSWIAYASVSDQIPTQNANLPFRPKDILIQNATTGETRRIATQPAEFSMAATTRNFTLRSQPAWSPSGRQVAWTEIETDQEAKLNLELDDERLVIYDLDARVSKVLVKTLPIHRFTDIYPLLSEVAWGLPGLAVLTHSPGKTFPELVTVYKTSGEQLSQSEPLENSGFQFSQIIWVEDGARQLVTSIVGDLVIDPLTGKQVIYPDSTTVTPELYSTLAPNGVTLYYGDKTIGEGNPVWLIAVGGVVKGELAAAGRYYFLSGLAISPDGKRAAYIVYPGQGTDGGLYIFRDGARVKLGYKNVLGVTWGPVAWRLRRSSVE